MRREDGADGRAERLLAVEVERDTILRVVRDAKGREEAVLRRRLSVRPGGERDEEGEEGAGEGGHSSGGVGGRVTSVSSKRWCGREPWSSNEEMLEEGCRSRWERGEELGGLSS